MNVEKAMEAMRVIADSYEGESRIGTTASLSVTRYEGRTRMRVSMSSCPHHVTAALVDAGFLVSFDSGYAYVECPKDRP